ncbi:hypothetical protein [Rosettibacter firmus]|uniref:hypothetical protein n=1 Tax=Rosettibacter firmus TaxID=3111522 RepID=UPI00336BDD6C
MKLEKEKIRVERLVDHLLSRGYMTLSRKYSKYLPKPPSINGWDIDVVASITEPVYFKSKYRKKIAIGITLSDKDLDDPQLLSRLNKLANLKTKSNSKVTLFVGVPANKILQADMIINLLDDEVKNKIKLVPIIDEDDR